MGYRGKTPEFIVDVMKQLVSEHGQSGTARLTGLTQSSISRYINGVGHPDFETIQKLSNYTGKTFEFKIEPER